jgi:hypothetical protein
LELRIQSGSAASDDAIESNFSSTHKGFCVFMLETVIGGLGDELIDLAKANLFR